MTLLYHERFVGWTYGRALTIPPTQKSHSSLSKAISDGGGHWLNKTVKPAGWEALLVLTVSIAWSMRTPRDHPRVRYVLHLFLYLRVLSGTLYSLCWQGKSIKYLEAQFKRIKNVHHALSLGMDVPVIVRHMMIWPRSPTSVLLTWERVRQAQECWCVFWLICNTWTKSWFYQVRRMAIGQNTM